MTTEATPLTAAAVEADRVVKRQKLCSAKFASAVDRLLSAVNDSRDKLSAGSSDSVISDLKQDVSAMGISSELHDQTKQLHGAIAKLGKASTACRPQDYCALPMFTLTRYLRRWKRHLSLTYARPAGQ